MTYSEYYYSRTSVTARGSAARIVPLLAGALHPASVLDVGCGGGAWLESWMHNGATDAVGVDTATAKESRYGLPADTFVQKNLEHAFDLGRKFALVQSLEVAEHLRPAASRGFVETLCRHGDVVLFSAAPPGQGGIAHYNEQPYDYWRALFRSQGYHAIDWLRPLLEGDAAVAWWYRYNTLLYANDTGMAGMPASMLAARIPERAAIRDLAPTAHRIRRLALRPLPHPLVTALARAAEALGRRD